MEVSSMEVGQTHCLLPPASFPNSQIELALHSDAWLAASTLRFWIELHNHAVDSYHIQKHAEDSSRASCDICARTPLLEARRIASHSAEIINVVSVTTVLAVWVILHGQNCPVRGNNASEHLCLCV